MMLWICRKNSLPYGKVGSLPTAFSRSFPHTDKAHGMRAETGLAANTPVFSPHSFLPLSPQCKAAFEVRPSQDRRTLSIQSLSRCGVALLLVIIVSGCTVTGPEASHISPKTQDSSVAASDRGNDCKRNRSRCIHEGSYEPTERDYAEREAKRLNRAALDRLRRSTGS